MENGKQGQHERDAGNHLRGHQHQIDGFFAPKIEEHQRIGSQRRQTNVQHDHRRTYDEAVQPIPCQGRGRERGDIVYKLRYRWQERGRENGRPSRFIV